EFKDELIKAGVDFDGAVKRFIESEDIYEEFLYRFTDDKNLSQLEEALAEGDIASAFKRAHTLKGITSNYGFINVYKAVIPITDILRNGSADGIEEYMAELKKYHSIIC
ncbi:MAG TPA: hypothetical protein DCZ23_03270, partial [Lachnospiraceae bacterium]|nr:hypothetical protein [Lachnospiraceae bacterium]